MKTLIIAVLFAFVKAGLINTGTKCVTIRGIIYEEEILKRGVNSPYQLSIDHDTNTLFFSYTSSPSVLSELFRIDYLNLKTMDYNTVSGIHGGFATAVDSKNQVIYMGGEDGIYTFDYDSKTAKNLNIIDKSIWQMFYKDALYFTTYPEEDAYVYKQGEVDNLNELKNRVMVLAVKKDGSYVFSNSSGLFTYSKNQGLSVNIGDYTVNGFSADVDGNIYFSTPSKIYYIDDKRNTIEELVTLDNVYGIAVESNGNIIYADENAVIRLKPTKKQCLDNKTV